jgi:myotubularin-related protein 1/2
LYVMDARPIANAMANQAVGAGFEDTNRYKQAKIRFLQIPNIHVMRESVRKLHELCLPNYNKSASSNFLSNLDSTHWLEYICLILHSSVRIARLINSGSNVLIHCSDGWDRTSQVNNYFYI